MLENVEIFDLTKCFLVQFFFPQLFYVIWRYFFTAKI